MGDKNFVRAYKKTFNDFHTKNPAVYSRHHNVLDSIYVNEELRKGNLISPDMVIPMVVNSPELDSKRILREKTGWLSNFF